MTISGWLIKYKIYYIAAWMLVSFFLMFLSYDIKTPIFPQWMGYMIVVGLAMPVCWYTAYKLTPGYLYQKKITLFIGFLFLLAFLNSIVSYLSALFVYHLLTGHPMFRSALYFFTILIEIFVVNIILISISCMIKMISDRYFMEQQLLQIEKEKVSTELNFLRSQVNPHFLFNVMNTIYFQIEKTNADARLSIEKFSEMLRYQLYECTSDKIPLQKELHYIENYVAIQTLRMEKGSDILLFINDDLENFLIAPLLILPIVENAFKHISDFKEAKKNRIHVTVTGGDHIFKVEVVNTYDQAGGQKHLLQSGGLGMQNLKRRLELLYPGMHELNIDNNDGTYKTILKLKYND